MENRRQGLERSKRVGQDFSLSAFWLSYSVAEVVVFKFYL
jgi:hypothetical protein